MIFKPSTWLVVVLAGGMLVTGCGSSSTLTTTTTAAAPTPTATTTAPKPAATVPSKITTTPTAHARTPTAHATTSTTSTASLQTTPVAKPAGQQQIVTACTHRSPSERSGLSSSLTAKLAKLCEKGTSGDAAAQHKILQEVCTELVDSSHIPAGAPSEQALAVCKTE